MLEKAEIVRALDEISLLLALKRESRFRVRAYERGARALEQVRGEIGPLIEEGRLTELPGVGPALAAQIAELWRTGRSSVLAELRSEVPPGAVRLAQVPGLTLRRIKLLHAGLGIESVEALRAACEAGRVRELSGFGPKTEQKLLGALALHDQAQRQLVLAEALTVLERLRTRLPGRVELSGEVRRYEATVERLALVIEHEPDVVWRELALLPDVLDCRPEEGRVRLVGGVWVDIHVAGASQFGSAQILTTGPASHTEYLAQRARERGLELSALAGDEPDVYRALGLEYVPPELRHDPALAAQGELVTLGDLRGAVHCHTVYSDGKSTIEQMARAAEAMGLRYITITDHSPSAFYAGGVTLGRLERQWDEIAEVQERVSVRILRGTESDILADGALDYPDRVLERLDVVIASIHSRHGQDAASMTARLISAMRHPLFKIWGHPLGRLLLRRPPVACDLPRIFDAIAESRAAVEINADPYRLDLPSEWIGLARERNIPFVISADAHSTRGLGVLHFGAGLARRGGLCRRDVLNTLETEAFLARVRPTQ